MRIAALLGALLVVVGIVAAQAQSKAATTVTLGVAAPDSLDPGVAQAGPSWDVINQMFVGLMRFDSRTGKLTPDLATGYTASPDLKTWTFTLRSKVKWSDGTPLTAADVVYGINRAKSLDPGGGVSHVVLAPISSVTALDPQTVQFQLTQPIAYLPALLSSVNTRPVPQQAIQQYGSSWTDPGHIVTSGAYTLVSRTATTLTLGQNSKYYGAYSINTVVYDFGDPSQMPDRYAAGQLDYLSNDVVPGGLVPALRTDPRFGSDLVVAPTQGTDVEIYNTATGPTVNSDVRRAFSAATDRARIASDDLGDASFATTAFTAPSVPGAPPSAAAGIGQGYDEAAAQRFQAAAGAAFPSSITIRYGAQNLRRQREAEILKEDWERIFGPGFTVVLDPEPGNEVIGSLANPDPNAQAPVTLLGWLEDYPDVDDFLRVAVGPAPGPQCGFQCRWSNDDYQGLVNRAAATLDSDTRKADYAAAEYLLTEGATALAPVYTLPDRYAHKSRVNVVGSYVENWSAIG
ncbi:MAG: peptide ABC transporter substrate-binding protein [Gaiellaceae bacterium]